MEGKSVVKLATTQAEKEDIYRLRYTVYIEEMGGAGRHDEANAETRQLRDAWDETAHHLYAVKDGATFGSLRINLRRDGPVECEDLLEVSRFAPAFPGAVSTASRFAIHPWSRGTVLMERLACEAYRFHRERELAFLFIDCHPRLLALYSRLGFRIYRPGFKHPKYVYVVPMVLVLDDLKYLREVNSPFAAIAREFPASTAGRELLLSLYPAAARAFVAADQAPDVFWNLLTTRMLDPTATFERSDLLAGLSTEETQRLLSMGHIISCQADDPVVSRGERGREIFLILEGSFQVLAEADAAGEGARRVLRVLAPGEVFGEVGFLTEGLRTASVRAMEQARLLVLDAKGLDRLAASPGGIAARIYRNLARIVALRLRDNAGF